MQGPLPGERKEKGIPEFVEDVNHSPKGVYNDVRWKLNKAHQKNKSKYDEKVTGSNLTVGDRVWLYVPAVKQEELGNCLHCGVALTL